MTFTGKVAIVTGGSRGIGHAIARTLLQNGARVAITATSEATLRKARRELGATRGEASVLPIRADVRRQADVETGDRRPLRNILAASTSW